MSDSTQCLTLPACGPTLRSEKDASALTAAVAAANLPTRPLVVLGACSTGLGRMRGNEGRLSARARPLSRGDHRH